MDSDTQSCAVFSLTQYFLGRQHSGWSWQHFFASAKLPFSPFSLHSTHTHTHRVREQSAFFLSSSSPPPLHLSTKPNPQPNKQPNMPKGAKKGAIKKKVNPEAAKAAKREQAKKAKKEAEKKHFVARPRNFGIGARARLSPPPASPCFPLLPLACFPMPNLLLLSHTDLPLPPPYCLLVIARLFPLLLAITHILLSPRCFFFFFFFFFFVVVWFGLLKVATFSQSATSHALSSGPSMCVCSARSRCSRSA